MKNNKQLISVIVPAYNCEDTIVQCVSSIMNQTYQKIEILLIDDKSTDATLEKCKRLSEMDQRISVLEQPYNKGVSAARNCGLEFAKGKYIAFCDADDTMREDMLQVLYDEIVQSSADIVCCAHSKIKRWITENEKKVIRDQKEFIKSLNQYGGFVWNKLFDADIIGTIRFHENLDLCEDTVFVTECFFSKEDSSMVYLPQRLYDYSYGGVTQGASNKHFKDGCYIYETAMRAASKISNGRYQAYYQHYAFILAVVERDFDMRYHNLSKENKHVLKACLKKNRKGFLGDKDIDFKIRIMTFGRYIFPYSKYLKR